MNDVLAVKESNDNKLKPGRKNPYHVFSILDEFFLFDTSTSRFYNISKAIFDFLKLSEQYSYSYEQAMADFSRIFKYDRNETDNVFTAMDMLFENGLWDTPKCNDYSELAEKQLEYLMQDAIDTLDLVLTETCNLRCKYCFCEAARDMQGASRMSEVVAKKAIDFLFSKKSKNLTIVFFGGEPLINLPVIKFSLAYSRKLAEESGKRVSYKMTTNGTLITDEVAELIKEHGVAMMVSLDGPEEYHDRQCPMKSDGSGSYHKVVRGINKLLSREWPTEVRGTLTHPMPSLSEFLDFYHTFNFSRIVLEPATNLVENQSPVDFREEDFTEYQAQREKMLPGLVEKLSRNKNVPYNPYKGLLKEIEDGKLHGPVTMIRCPAGCSSVAVSAKGELSPCTRFNGAQSWVLGDLEKGLPLENMKKFWEKYRKSIELACISCWAWPLCKGPCPASNMLKGGGFEMNFESCKGKKAEIEQAAYIYTKLSLAK